MIVRLVPPAERHEFGMEYDDVSPIRGTTWHTYSLYLPKDTHQIYSEWITMGQFHNLDYKQTPYKFRFIRKTLLPCNKTCLHTSKKIK